jgi:primosomal protein N'
MFQPERGASHVVDADSSQTRVIEAVRAGHNLVVQGPPGTGKSQTITNIIAAAVHDGQTVLFIAEKMAALNAVPLAVCLLAVWLEVTFAIYVSLLPGGSRESASEMSYS